MGTNKLTCWLFKFRGRQWWRNIKEDIPIFIHRIFFTLKHGYSPVAQFETSQWFMDVMKEILVNYRNNRVGTPFVIDDAWDEEKCEENEDTYNKILDRMIELLDLMDKDSEIYDHTNWKETYEKVENAKNEFFQLFSENFYGFWD